MAVTELEADNLVSTQRVFEATHFETIEATYRESADVLLRLAIGLVGSSNAEDLVATAVAKCLSARSGGRVIEDPAAYLYRSVVNEGTSFYRRAGVRARSFRVVDGAAKKTARDHSEGVVGSMEVQAALLALPARQRAVCVLTYWEDKSIAEIATLLDISEGSVKKHLARARASLRKGLES